MDFGINKFITEKNIKSKNVGRILEIFNRKVTFITASEHKYSTILTNKYLSHFKYKKLLIGDFIEYDEKKQIIKVFSRLNVLSKAYSKAKKSFKQSSEEQEMAANIDSIVIMIAVNQHFTIEKLERYLETFHILGHDPTILLSKIDFTEERNEVLKKIRKAYPSLQIREVSIYDDSTIGTVKQLFKKDCTVAVIGASGVGKSTLLNYLTQKNIVETGKVRKGDQKGKHTTTRVTLHSIPSLDSYYLDTPGFKAISTNLKRARPEVFDDIYELAKECKFNNCKHISEPKCAVKEALKKGNITQDHYDSYLKYAERINS